MRAGVLAAICRPVCLAGLCGLAVGCARKYPGDARFPLSGQVTADGEPIEMGSISFVPAGGGEQRVSGGAINLGAYAVPEAKGANAGPYRVEIHWAKKTGKQLKDEDGNPYDERKEALPERYHRKSELTADVSANKTTFDFDLKTK